MPTVRQKRLLPRSGGQNVHCPTEADVVIHIPSKEALLPINNRENMSIKHEICNIIYFFKYKLFEKVA